MSKKKKKNRIPKRRNAMVSVMFRRHPRTQVMKRRGTRRGKDAKNSWRKEWE